MTTMDAAVDHLYPKTPSEDGIWVGVDFGTSNSSCAIWDSAGGRSKWIRLPRTLSKLTTRGKHGRTMPSAVLYIDDETELVMGQAAMDVVDEVLDAVESHKSSTTTPTHTTPQDVSEALVTSVKRILGLKPQQIQENVDLSLPLAIEFREEQVVLRIHPLKNQQVMYVTPLHVTASMLREIRRAAQTYVDGEGKKKKLQVPGQGRVRNCVIGVPAHFGRSQRKLMEEACRMAGWDGHISTITESTAAAMAYGLFVSSSSSSSPSHKKHILVFDMGGGTTDLTICDMSEESSRVMVAVGDNRLGGDDMDEHLLQLVLEKHGTTTSATTKQQRQLTVQQRRYLLRACRRGKELLCGSAEEPPADSCIIVWDGKRVQITQEEFYKCIECLIQRAHDLVQGAMERYASMSLCSTDTRSVVDEVVLVGGATRVPAVRTMLQHLFSSLELCSSVNAESAVAQGAAIQAALRSGLVPKHELRSALMLDALPHSIGVQMDNGTFFPMLDKDAQLPAMGYATFALAHVHQPGVTLVAVEDVGDELPLERIGEFTFLLRRLSEEELSKLNGTRTVDIGMTMETSGEFVVSVFDSNDPEHVEKKRRYQQHKAGGVELGYHDDGPDKGSKMTRDEMIMVAGSVFLFLMYILVKLVFHDPLEESAGISNRQY